MSERLPFLNEEEQARLDALPDDYQEPVADLMKSMHRVRPDLNQPGKFGSWFDVVERYVASD